MSKQVFQDGTVLLTGEDMTRAFEAMLNSRGAYDIDCSFCQSEGDEEYCDGCSISDTDISCSCHLNPPCSKCVDSKFEVSLYLINYEAFEFEAESGRYVHFKGNGKRRWQCFKGDRETFEKLTELENAGLKVAAEILSTGEASIYIEHGIDMDLAHEICNRRDVKTVMSKMIMDCNIMPNVKDLLKD